VAFAKMAAKKIKLPENISLDADQQREFNQKVNQIKKENKTVRNSSVVYVGHIPNGFFEEQMRAYFSQFGNVKRLRIARSKKTGNIKGYAFVEFESDVVAKVVADSMNNYLMFNRLLKCQVVMEDKLHVNTFRGCNRSFTKPKAHLVSTKRHNRVRTLKEEAKQMSKLSKKLQKSLGKLKSKGIDYSFNLPDSVEVKEEPLSPVACQDMEVLFEDSSEDEISFRTPPNSIKSSKLKSGASTGAASAAKKYKDTQATDTPVTTTTTTRSSARLRKRKAAGEDVKQEKVVKTKRKK